jgi:hypothetical protein
VRVNGAVDVFVSYRRDDTGGRAGRLADALATRFGQRHVFQDVTALAPGASFDDQVDHAIAASDVVLVVIGREWASDPDGHGGRRLDHPDDFVRHEVRAALRGDVVVVPVLVDGAELPKEASLPEDLRPLVRRQAATIRDESWHRDVDALIRQLTSGPDVVAPGRRNRALLVAVLLALLAVAIVWVLVARGGEDSSEDDEPPTCEAPDETWTAQAIEREPVAFEDTDGNRQLSIAPESWAWTPDGDDFLVLVTASVTNTSDSVPGTGEAPYITYTDVADLAVNRIQTSDLRCVTYVGSQELPPGRTVLMTLGFSTTQSPDGAPIVLDMQDGSEVPVVGG